MAETPDQQTATSEILRVIASAPTDLQPVFAAIAADAARLCTADDSLIFLIAGGTLRLVATYGDMPVAPATRDEGIPVSRDAVVGRAVLERRTIHVPDLPTEITEYPESRRFGLVTGTRTLLAVPLIRTPRLKTMQSYRTILAVPMIREGIPIGALALWRREVRPFSESEIGLVQTFADQAVIAIENVRLFNELQTRTGQLTRSVDELTALGEVSRTLSSSLDLETVLQMIVVRANQLAGTAGCVIWEYDESGEASAFARATTRTSTTPRSSLDRAA